MKEIIISDEDKTIKLDEIRKKIERLDVFISRAQRRVEMHIDDLEKIADKYDESKEMAEEHLTDKGKVDLDL